MNADKVLVLERQEKREYKRAIEWTKASLKTMFTLLFRFHHLGNAFFIEDATP